MREASLSSQEIADFALLLLPKSVRYKRCCSSSCCQVSPLVVVVLLVVIVGGGVDVMVTAETNNETSVVDVRS